MFYVSNFSVCACRCSGFRQESDKLNGLLNWQKNRQMVLQLLSDFFIIKCQRLHCCHRYLILGTGDPRVMQRDTSRSYKDTGSANWTSQKLRNKNYLASAQRWICLQYTRSPTPDVLLATYKGSKMLAICASCNETLPASARPLYLSRYQIR